MATEQIQSQNVGVLGKYEVPAFPTDIFPQPMMSPEESEYRAVLQRRIWSAYWQREQRWEEFNDQTYSARYFTNRRAAIAYIPNKLNPEETEVVSGTTHQKVLTLLSILKGYNYEANIIAYDEDNKAYVELGKLMEDLVKKVLILDDRDEQEILEILEFLQQGDVFVEVYWKEQIKTKKKIIKPFDGKKVEWETEKQVVNGKICTRVIPGINVYLGNMREYFLQSQPYIFTLELMSYADAKTIYGSYDNFQYVPRSVRPFANTTTFRDQSGRFFLFSNVQEGFVEVVKYYDKPNNEYQIFLNGIMMLPIKVIKNAIEGFPLSYISPSGEYPIAKGSGEPLSTNFAYSRSIPEDTKVLQAIKDEQLRLMVLKTQQSYKPPMANMTGRQITRSAFAPGKITDGIRIDQLSPMLQATGVTSSEIAAMNIINQMIDENSAANIMSGDTGASGNATATQIQAQRQQSMVKIGSRLVGVMSYKRQVSWLVLYLSIDRFTRVEDEKINEITGELEKRYKEIMMNATIENGRKGIKMVRFDKNAANQSSDLTKVEENILTEEQQKPVRLFYIDPEMLRETLDWVWNIEIVPTPVDTTELRKAQFKDTVMTMAQLPPIGQQINWQYVAQKLVINEGLNPEEFLIQQQQQPGQNPMAAMMQQQGSGAQSPSAPGGAQNQQMMQQIKNQTPQNGKPNINTLNNQM